MPVALSLREAENVPPSGPVRVPDTDVSLRPAEKVTPIDSWPCSTGSRKV